MTLLFVFTALAFTGIAQAQTAQRLDRIENPPVTQIASNATTAQIDFGSPSTEIKDYYVHDLSGNITLQLTNLSPGRTCRVHVDTDGSARTVAIATNGITLTPSVIIHYPYTIPTTNGSSAYTVTNQSRFNITVSPDKRYVDVTFQHWQP